MLASWDRQGRERHDPWREVAKEDFAFAAGHQWDQADLNSLREAKRPSVTFDRIGRNINAVCGLEINNRQRAATYPREVGDIEESEIPTAALAFVADETDAEDEKSEAFRDMLICGIGWTNTEMNYLEHEDGMPTEVRTPVDQMNWDPFAKKKNLSDRRWQSRALTLPIEEAKRMFPDHEEVVLNAGWANILESDWSDDTGHEPQSYEATPDQGSRPKLQRVTLIEMQWREIERIYQVEDRQTGERHEVKKQMAELIADNAPNRFAVVERERYVYWRAILGSTILRKDRLEHQKDFTYQPMTGFWDATRQCWFGLVRGMKDPQRVANNLYSHSLSMFKHGAKNGVMYEKSAVKDVRRFERTQAKVGANVEFEDGALSGGKVQPINPAPPPQHAHELLSMSLGQVQEGVGIPIEMVATAAGNGPAQTAALETERRKTGMNLLAPFFAAKRAHLKRQAKLTLRYVTAFMNDGRLMRIVSEGQTKYVQLFLEDPDVTKYDIIIDENPTSPDKQERSWMVIQQILPMLERMGAPPDLFIEVARYVPDMPAQLLSKFAKAIEEANAPSEEKKREEELKARGEAAAVAKEEGQAEKERTAALVNEAKVKQMAGELALKATESMRETALAAAAPSVNVVEIQ